MHILVARGSIQNILQLNIALSVDIVNSLQYKADLNPLTVVGDTYGQALSADGTRKRSDK